MFAVVRKPIFPLYDFGIGRLFRPDERLAVLYENVVGMDGLCNISP
jgi:hypothetical protein